MPKSPNSYSNKVTKKSKSVDKYTDDKKFHGQTHTKKIYKEFSKKKDALEYIKKKDNDTLALWNRDIKEGKKYKKIIVASRNTIYKKIKELSKNDSNHCSYYECFERKDLVKLFIDIDYKLEKRKVVDIDMLMKDTLTAVINTVNNEVDKYIKVKPEIIVLTACTSDKVSLHVIYNNIYFESIYHQKYFFSQIEHKFVDDGIIDLAVYKVGTFRTYKSSKIGKKNTLKYYKGINYEKPKSDKELFMDSLITTVNDDCKMIKCDALYPGRKKNKGEKGNKKEKRIKVKSKKKQGDIPLYVLEKYVKLLSKKRADNYNDWNNLGICLHWCNEKSFDLWHEFSKQSKEKYKGKNDCAKQWNDYEGTYSSLNTLKLWTLEDNYREYYKLDLEKQNFKYIEMKKNYLKGLKEVIKDRKSMLCKQVDNLMNGKFKTLAICSPYDSGKTTIVRNILKEYDPKRILFVTYRQSLAQSLHGAFVDDMVCNYLSGSFTFDADRLICQYDSLKKTIVDSKTCMFNKEFQIPKYDLVVVDEIESVLNHTCASTIKNKEFHFDIFKNILKGSTSILALDGDFGNRSYDFLKELGSCKVVKNVFEKGGRHFIFTDKMKTFDDKIEKSLKDGKNVVIVSMSSTIATEYNKRYSKKYKTALYCSRSDDEAKSKLNKVEEEWVKYKLVIYTPTVESGVDMSVEHFDDMYIILSKNSCTYRALSQMAFRVRKLRNNNIYVFTNGLPFNEAANIYSYEDTKKQVFETIKQYMKRIVKMDGDNLVMGLQESLWTKMVIYHEQEKLNSRSSSFIYMFLKLLVNKGHTYDYLDRPKKKKDKDKKDDKQKEKKVKKDEKNKTNIMKDELLETNDITDEEYKLLYLKKITNNATKEDKLKIEKHKYKLDWGVDEIDEDFLNKFYRKTPMLNNLRALMYDKKIKNRFSKADEVLLDLLNNKEKNEFEEVIDKHTIDYFDKKWKEKCEIVKKLLKDLDFSFDDTDKIIKKEIFEKRMRKLIKNDEVFTKPKIFLSVFGLKSSNVKSTRSFLGFMNKILLNYGLRIKTIQQTTHKNKKKINMYYYKLRFINDIDKYCNIS